MNCLSNSATPSWPCRFLALGIACLIGGVAQVQYPSADRKPPLPGSLTNQPRTLSFTYDSLVPDRSIGPAGPPSRRTSNAELARTEAQLRDLLALDPTHISANLRLALIELARGQTNVARQRLETIAHLDPRPALYLARFHAAEQRTAQASAWARMATTNFHAATVKANNDAPAMRIAAARAHLMLGEYETAASLLAQGLQAEDRLVYRNMLGEVVAEWASAAPTPEVRLAILRKGLPDADLRPPRADLLAPARNLRFPALAQSPRFLREWIILSHATNEAGAAARREMDRRLADTNQAPVWLAALGAYALERGDQLESRRFYVRAAELSPRAPALLNNAAMMLCRAPDTESRKRALELIEAALRLVPNEPEYRDTRGQVYLALGRPAQALVDLEAVVDKVSDPAATHRAIAQAYRTLGRDIEAAQHESASQSLSGEPHQTTWDDDLEP